MKTPIVRLLIHITLTLGLIWSLPSFAGNKNMLVYSGRLVTPSGTPENSNSVTFTFQILAPNGCMLWQEVSAPVNMAGSNGAFTVNIGAGANSAPGGLGWTQIFQNGYAMGGGSLSGTGCPGTYTGGGSDDRTMYVQFNDGSGSQTVGPVVIKANALNAGFGGYPINMPSGAPTNNQVLTFDSTNNWWYPSSVAGGSVTSVTGGPGINITGTAAAPIVNLTTPVAVANGGTGIAGGTSGGIPYFNGAASLASSGVLTLDGIVVGGGAGGAPTTLGLGTSGQVLTSAGAGLPPTWQTPSAGTVTSVTAGTGIVMSGTAAAPVVNLATPVGVTNGGTGLASTTINQIVYSSAANTLSGLPTAANGVLVTSAGGVPSISGTLPAAVQSNITTTGTITSGTWTGSVIGVPYGGTGMSSYTTGDVVYASGAATLAGLHDVAAGQALVSGGVGAVPAYSNTIGGVQLSGGNATFASTKGIVETDSGGNTVTLVAPTSITANYTMKLPIAQSVGTQALVNDGSGNLSWQNLSAGSVTSVTAGTGITLTGTGAAPIVNLTTPVVIANGGTNNTALGVTNGGIVYTDGTKLMDSAAGSVNQVLISGGAGAPAWSGITMAGGNAITYPAGGNLSTTGANDNVVTGTNTTSTSINLNVTGVNGGITLGANGTGTVSVNGTAPTVASVAGKNLTVESSIGNITYVGNTGTTSGTVLQSGTGGVTISGMGPGILQVNGAGLISATTAAAGNVLTSQGAGVAPIWAAPGAAANVPLSGITAATGANSINSGINAQVWNWQLTGNTTAMNFSENAASTGGTGTQDLVKISTLAASTANPFHVKAQGNEALIVGNTGNVGVGVAAPAVALDVNSPTASFVSVANFASNPGATGAGNFPVISLNNKFGAGNYKSGINFQGSGAVKWQVNVDHNGAGVQDFSIFDFVASSTRLLVDANGNVGIGTTSPGALLDLSSTTNGFLMPRMTTAQRTAIAAPATGLEVYDTTGQQIYYYNGSSWQALGVAGAGISSITAGTGLTGGTITTSGTIGLGTELTGVNGLSTTGFVERTGAGAYTTVAQIGLTTDVTGVLPIANGGTNNGTLGVTNGGIVYTDGTKLMDSAAGSVNQVMISGGAGAPTWSNITMVGGNAITYPAGGNLSTTGANDNVITGTNTTSTSINLNVTGVNGGITLGANGTGTVSVAGSAPTMASVAGKNLTVESSIGNITYLGNPGTTSGTVLQSGSGGITMSGMGPGILQVNGSGLVSATTAASGQVLTSQGAGVAPIWAAPGAAANVPLSGITAATGANSINSGVNAQTWNWQLTGNTNAMSFSENAASTGGTGTQNLVNISTLAASTASPLHVKAQGNEAFYIGNTGKVGIGTITPADEFTIYKASIPTFKMQNGAFNNMEFYNGSTGNEMDFNSDDGGADLPDWIVTVGNASSGNPERFRINGAGKVGINAPAPGAQLEIDSSGNAVIAQTIKAPAAPSTNIWQVTNNAGAAQVYVDSSFVLHGDGSLLTGVSSVAPGATKQIPFNNGAGLFTAAATATDFTYDDTAKKLSLSGTTPTSDAFVIPATPYAGAGASSTSLMRLGTSDISLGSASGTYFGINSGGGADLMNLQITGNSAFIAKGNGNTGFNISAGFTPVDYISFGGINMSPTHAFMNVTNTALVGASGSGTYIGGNAAAATSDFINYQVSNTSAFFVSASGKLGVGTGAPGAQVEIDSSGNGVIAESLKAPAAPSTNIWQITNNAGAPQVYVDSSFKLHGDGSLLSGISSTPGGANTQIQFNNSGAFAGSANFVWDNTNYKMTLDTSNAPVGDALMIKNSPAANGTSALLQIGPADLVGGDAQGQFIGVNTAAGFSGTLVNLQKNGVTQFKINNDGAVNIPVAPKALAGEAQISLGTTAINGSASGTYIGANPASAGADFINYQIAGTTVFKVDANGNIITTGTISGSGGAYVPLAGGTMTGALVNNTSSASTALAVTQSGAGNAATFMGGNLGIGTTSPNAPLQIGAGASFGTPLAFITGIPDPNINAAGQLIRINDTSATGANTTFAGIAFSSNPGKDFIIGKKTVNAGSPNYFQVRSNDSVELFTVSDAGNVGIGTASPTSLLSVGGVGLANAGMSVYQPSGGEDAIQAYDSIGANMIDIRPGWLGTTNFITSDFPSGGPFLPLALSGREVIGDFVLATNGNVGIRTVSPAQALEVNGSIQSDGQVYATEFGASGTATADFSKGNVQILNNPGQAAITLNNMKNGAAYTVVIPADSSNRQYTFTNCATSKFVPANTTVTNYPVVYSILYVNDAANGIAGTCLISYVYGFQ